MRWCIQYRARKGWGKWGSDKNKNTFFTNYDINHICPSSIKGILSHRAQNPKIRFRERKEKTRIESERDLHSSVYELYLTALVSGRGVGSITDGLWSSCGDERIIVFTTNYKGKLDPALLRPGRMDMNISTCLTAHHLVELIKKVEVNPAEVAEDIMRSDDANV
ncbi:hypothetical protein F8388_006250 [Cannabis sativa]|uniref:Uncharacterized protein n=1 Tax=Cannabis sativa TaxID=3483 RepID=A0A7J6G9N0_CANSA|nr:hypothetical protein F8388_006250 [Cannabis sativa]